MLLRMKPSTLLRHISLSLLVIATLSFTVFAQELSTYIRAGKLFDGRSNQLQTNIVIVVQGKKILRVGGDVTIPSGATVIDLSQLTVMPGLIDAHTHIVLHAGDYDAQILRETPEFRAIYATRNARLTLESGVTTIRDLGNEGSGFADVALRDAIAQGIVPGPRIVAAIRPVTSTGAYRLVGYSPYQVLPPISASADGPSEIRKEVTQVDCGRRGCAEDLHGVI
jgi:imidazolonepropionase-like amidohydrolase